ncbi:5'-methylthioadenosine/S-adenosylhomocysteine nucleosidase family protein [Anabaena subtropica]|uniref:Phosphorylase n=1 Tax=Anabaena subtropica FACHB-260 TaxID=2692884 RepID=A0ABR8CT09_9NOST|nr:phosphorylase [Anabaena subtropica]MBD2345926.1 phosphorylase [Anabaena subtropica FACHB-260]
MIIDTIFVPQGSEYGAVCRGLRRISGKIPKVVAIPVGVKPLTTYLQQWQKQEHWQNAQQSKVLVMGLCGSLTTDHCVGDVVLYESCIYQQRLQECDRSLTTKIYSALQTQYPALNLVKSLTSDRVVCSAVEKRYLGETLGADVVDMEGFAALELLNKVGATVAMLRVVSDDCRHDIPDITAAINVDGSLQPLPLTLSFLRQPIAATRLIRGSLRGLKVLEQLTTSLFSEKFKV